LRSPLLPLVALALALSTARSVSADATSQVCIHAAEEGQRLRAARKIVGAREQLIACARDVCPAMVRKDCAQWLSEDEVTMPTVVLGARTERGEDVVDVRVSIDGAPVAERLSGASVPVDPGPHVLRFEAAGYPPVQQQIVVREGEKSRLVIASLPPRPKGPIPAGFWVFGGLGVAGGAGFAVLALLGEGDLNNLRSTCAPNCTPSSVDSARVKFILANVSLGVGIASAAVAAGILIWRSPSGKTTALSVTPSPGGGMAGVSLSY
jgi:hypothetical protein